jgi:hypothetical protein
MAVLSCRGVLFPGQTSGPEAFGYLTERATERQDGLAPPLFGLIGTRWPPRDLMMPEVLWGREMCVSWEVRSELQVRPWHIRPPISL